PMREDVWLRMLTQCSLRTEIDVPESPQEPSAMRPLELWKSGIVLSEAWFSFASKSMRRSFNRPPISEAIGPKSTLEMLIASFRDAGPEKEQEVKKAALELKNQLISRQHESELRWQMQKALIDELKREKFVAIGFRDAPELDALPTIIPPRFLDMKYFD